MTPLVIKCYLPDGRSQYVLQPAEQVKVTFGEGGTICPPGFVDRANLTFSVVDGAWLVSAERGDVRLESGESLCAAVRVSTPMLLMSGYATLALDSVVDPRIAHQVVGQQRPAAKSPPRPIVKLQSPSIVKLPSPSIVKPPSPPIAKPLNRATGAPLGETRVMDPPAVERALVEADDLARAGHVGKESSTNPGAESGARSPVRSALYALLAAAVAISGFGMIRASDAAEVAQAAAKPLATANSAQLPTAADTEKPRVKLNTSPDARRAAEAFATGNFEEALSHYKGLAAAPNADPVFNVIARALEQRARRNKVKKP